MNKLEQNALRIAELIGWRYDYTDQHNERRYSNGCPSESEKYLTMWFSSYNGLMPIVFECNHSEGKDIIVFYLDGVGFMNGNETNRIETDYIAEPEFIEAIQLACIKYLELKNG